MWFILYLFLLVGAFGESTRTGMWVVAAGLFVFFGFIMSSVEGREVNLIHRPPT
jgi:hypothetical protein